MWVIWLASKIVSYNEINSKLYLQQTMDQLTPIPLEQIPQNSSEEQTLFSLSGKENPSFYTWLNLQLQKNLTLKFVLQSRNNFIRNLPNALEYKIAKHRNQQQQRHILKLRFVQLVCRESLIVAIFFCRYLKQENLQFLRLLQDKWY